MRQLVESMTRKTPASIAGGPPVKSVAARRKAGVARGRRLSDDSGGSRPLNFKELARFLDGVAIESEAAERGVCPRQILEELPRDVCRMVPSRCFLAVMDDVATWGPVAVPLNTADGIVEFNLTLPRGEIKADYFYWLQDGPIRGRLRISRCAGIAFVERPFLGRPSAAVLFFNRDGNLMFKIFLARDDNHQLDPKQVEQFRALAKRLSRRGGALGKLPEG
ncbi:MAG: heme utilization cystosolic carrier protein HutX [Rhodopseudomonas sp.]|nr:heme utilization cystosolic carrier protein HutX [Rhodopseudomonas sp.]